MRVERFNRGQQQVKPRRKQVILMNCPMMSSWPEQAEGSCTVRPDNNLLVPVSI